MADVAIAASLAFEPETGKTMWQDFRSDRGCEDPITAAMALEESCRDDFPGWLWSVASNDEAGRRRSATLLRTLGLEPDTPAPVVVDGEQEGGDDA